MAGDVEVRPGAGSKRVHGPRPLPPPPASPRCLAQQEVAGPGLQREHCGRSFSHFRLLHRRDCYAGEGDHWPPFFLRRRSAVCEVLAVEGLVLALCQSGVCTAFLSSGQPLCHLNLEADEVIRSLVHNPAASAIICVSVFSGDRFEGLRVRSTPLASIRRGSPHAGWRPLFATEVLAWPGFVEFDDVNDVVVTRCAHTRRYKVWDLRAPHVPLYHVDGRHVRDLKVANGALLLSLEPKAAGGGLRLHVLDLARGDCLQELAMPGPPGGASWDLVELFGRHLLTKARGGPLRITDIVSGVAREVDDALFPAPHAFIHLPFSHRFLAFWDHRGAQLWSLRGERLATLADARLSAGSGNSAVFVTDAQDLMFVYCPPCGGPHPAAGPGGGSEAAGSSQAAGEGAQAGCVRVYNLLTGRQVAAVQAPAPASGGKRPAAEDPQGGAASALCHVTTLFYDQQSHRLYTGTADGWVQAWGL